MTSPAQPTPASGPLGKLLRWFEDRLQLKDSVWPLLRHPVPRGLGWWYVFGSATLAFFILQVVTGICLTLVYVPSGAEAWESLRRLNFDVWLGWYLRAVHYWSGSAMTVMMLLHMTQVFLMGGYKYPRELTWLIGVGLFVLVLGMMFTGQVLRWDSDAYWGLGVGASMIGRLPGIGEGLMRLVMGGPEVAGDALSRFFTLHVFWLPGLIVLLLVPHLYLVMKLGISSRPEPGHPVNPETYHLEYAEKLKKGQPFYPYDMSKDMVFSGVAILFVLGFALVFGPKGPSLKPDPAMVHTEPRPDWPFLWLFAILALCPPKLETLVQLALPPVGILILCLVPFIGRRGERAPSRRPVAVLLVLVIFVSLGILTWLGYSSPWSPRMDAWSKDPIPDNIIKQIRKEDPSAQDEQKGPRKNLALRRLQGAAVFQYKSCRNCHALGGVGGQRGPDLTTVATRLNRTELIRQVLQGGGNMPPYGKQLKPAEVEALVAFLQALHPPHEPGARENGQP
jgi:ubiquinol-cytochrome c reductase cytochrome b subunit